jgi:ELWxxDGT repeat protein
MAPHAERRWSSTSDPAPKGSQPNKLTAPWFLATDVTTGYEIWRTDGTTAGTVLHQEVVPGPAGFDAQEPVLSGGNIFFRGNDWQTGEELWAMPSMACAVPFGEGCPGTNGIVPRVRSTGGAPALGNVSFALQVDRTPPFAACALELGLARADLPVPTGCHLYVDCSFVRLYTMADTNGVATLSLPVPNDPSLRGGRLFGQFAVADPGGAFYGLLSLTSGIEVIVADN